MTANDDLEIPCLGKPFQLGMLYDCRSDCLIPDITLLEGDILNNALVSRHSSQRQYEVFTDDNFNAKMEMVKANASFRLSLLSGLANVPNYAHFLEDISSLKKQVQVTLKLEKISRSEELDFDLMRGFPLEYENEDKNATHFVSRVLYGSNSYFVFDRELKRNESHATVCKEMQDLISDLLNYDEIPEMDKEDATKLTCAIYDDSFLQKSSISCEEALEVLVDLKNNDTPEVPIRACLQALGRLDVEVARCVTKTDSGTLSHLQSILEDISYVNSRINVLTKTKAFLNFSSIQKKISKFQTMVSQYTKTLKKDLSTLLLRVRSGEAVQKELISMLEKTVTTPFHEAYLSSWVDKTEREVNLLSMYLGYFDGIQFAFEPDELDSVISSLDYDNVVCFSFMIDDFQDEQRHEMCTYLRTGKWNKKPPDESNWCENKVLLNGLKAQAKLFSGLAKSKTRGSNTKFVVSNIGKEGKGETMAVIQLFREGQEIEFEPNKIHFKPLTTDSSAGFVLSSTLKTFESPKSTVFDATKSIRSKGTTERDYEPEETTQIQHGQLDFDRRLNERKKTNVTTRARPRDNSKMRPKITTSDMRYQDRWLGPESSQNFAPCSCQCQKNKEDYFSREHVSKASDLSPNHERQMNQSSLPLQPRGENEMPCRSPLADQVQKMGKETNEDVDRRCDSDSRKNGTKMIHEVRTSISLPETESRRNERSESNDDIDLGNNYPAKRALLHERRGAEKSSFDQSSVGMRPVVNPEDTTKPPEKAGPSLAQRMRHNSKEMECGPEEFVSVYKIPMEGEMRQEGKLIVRKSLKYQLDGVELSTQEARKEKVLLVMGATGAGKSTLINGMVNYIMGVEWEDEFRFKLVSEEVSSQANSVTKEITAYTIHPLEGSNIPYKFTIIDTPGFGDTEGLSRDVFITSQIQEFFSLKPPHGIDHLDGVGFVTQASLPRLTPTQKYIFDSILSIFGRDVENNFFMMITFSDGKSPPVLEAIKKAQISYQSYFKFNNSALFAKNTNSADGPQFDKMFWEMGRMSFKNFFEKFVMTDSVSLQLTNEVLKEREHLEALVEGLNPQIKEGLGKIEEMRQEKRILQQHETEIEHSKEFEFFVPVLKTEITPLKGTGRHTTTCLKCNYTCHKDCKIADDDRKRGCAVMDKEGKCTVCTGKCSWDGHNNRPYLVEYKTVQEKRTSADLKKKYDTAVSGKSNVEDMLQKLERCLNELRLKVLSDMYKVRQCLRRLDEIALKPNPLTEVQYIELLIENEKKEGRPGWMDRVRAFEDVKKKAKLFTKIKREEDIPKLLDELIPMEQGRSKSKQIKSPTDSKRNELGCVLQ